MAGLFAGNIFVFIKIKLYDTEDEKHVEMDTISIDLPPIGQQCDHEIFSPAIFC